MRVSRLERGLIILAALMLVAALAAWFGFRRPARDNLSAAGPQSSATPSQQNAANSPGNPTLPVSQSPDHKPASDEAAAASTPAPQQAPAAAKSAGQDQPGAGPAGRASAGALPSTAAAEPPPAFDVVRVEPNGEAVIAGRAAPGATVELLSDGKVHDRVVADPSGLFAMTPPPLLPGAHALGLRFTAPDGQQRLSEQSVAVSVAADGKSPPLVTLAAPGKPTVVLAQPATSSPPDGATAQESAPVEPGKAAASSQARIASVEAAPGGKLFVTGKAAPGSTVRLYLNDSYLASATADPKGDLSFSIAGGVPKGDYKVRLDTVDPATGQVKARAEVPFVVPEALPATVAETALAGKGDASDKPAETPSPAPRPQPASAKQIQTSPAASASAIVVPEIRTAIVARGDSLWRISQRIYGEGIRYTTIYDANEKQIRDPDLIYPGQVFVLPREGG